MPSLTVENQEAQPFRANAEHSAVNVDMGSPQQKQCSDHMPKQQGTISYPANGNASSNSNGIAYRQMPPHPATALEQYRLQLYNYALNIERLRCPQYTAAATAMAAAAAYANNNGGSAAPINNVHYLPHAAATNRLAALSSISLFPQRIFQPEEPKPQHSYIGLIAMAILSSSELKLVLSDIYQYILDNYPYFRSRGPGWRNSIRHNLSLNDCFIKSGRSANGKGHYWAIHPANMEDFRKGDFRRRKAQRKVRKHMGLSVDDAGMDSPSPPPLDLTAPPPTSQVAMQQLAAFGYPYHQHYIGQLFGRNVVAGGLSHYATLHRGQHPQLIIPQQQQQQQTSQQQQAVPQPPQQDNHPPSHQHVAYINSTTTTTIANLYSQTRKRQFDMASLLAPDVQLIDVEKNLEPPAATRTTTTTETQHTVITKVSVQQHRELLVELDEHEVEVDADIDVVDASDLEEENDPPVEFRASKRRVGDLGVDDNISYLSDGRRSSFEAEAEVDADTESFLPQVENSRINSLSPLMGVAAEIRQASAIYAGSLSSNSSHHDSASLGECPVATESQHRHQPSPSPQPLQDTHTELNHMDPHIFGRYYGSYMAAAAARRIGLATTPTSSSIPQSQNARSPH